MSAATATTPTVARSSSRRQQSQTSPLADRPHRTPSSAIRTPTAPGDQSHTHGRTGSITAQSGLAGVARRDYETSNVAARPPSSRRSSSRDRPFLAPSSTHRTESTRSTNRTSSRPGHGRYNSETGAAANAVANGGPTPIQDGSGRGGSIPPTAVPGAPPAVKRRTTIGAQTGEWSLGKTIGAGSMGKVKLAKNLETGEQVAVKIVPRQSTDEHHTVRDRERADHSKEVRTAREAAIVTLLNHPYICAMRDVVRTNYHWYMLFEYVNGGQMLDYIISHGRLKEKQARKFGRQIASALDYCHRNSIVHRDLKIENILISKTGDIKIIDFGLSNLFAPKGHLKTFCGSLYFAAPELLQAKQYTGPEVDIWSFGIVLYVLVCGKVPFDDQSMPQLHAKIKKGVVDYPAWLSAECRGLISRMLVTDPKQRASLVEILNHPWMVKGFNAPPENYLPHREPLQLPLDELVVEKMTGFDFGPSDYISRELTKVIQSDDYQHALRLNTRDAVIGTHGGEKRRGVFDFYKRRSSTTSRDTLPNSSAEAVQLGSDPTNAFSPLLSIYYLVREKQERERLEANPGALNMPTSPGEAPLKMPDLPAPEAAYTNSSAFEMPGEKATGGRSRPRARTHGEDEVTEGMKKVDLGGGIVGPLSPTIVTTPPTHQQQHQPQQPRRESTAAGILRRFSTRRHKDSPRSEIHSPPPTVQLQPPSDMAAPPRKSFSVRRPRNREAPSLEPMIHSAGSQPNQPQLLTPPIAGGSNVMSRTGSKLLGRSASVNSTDYRSRYGRRGVSDGVSTTAGSEPPHTSGSDRSTASVQRTNNNSLEPNSAPSSEKPKQNARSASLRTKSLGHARRESIQARRAQREESSRQSNVPEETDQEHYDPGEETDERGADTAVHESMKPVFLKGLFSVSTTSNKPLPVIRADIIRVLKQLGVDYTEIKGGFSCRHAPSIDLQRGGGSTTRHEEKISPSSPDPDRSGFSPKDKRRISFGNFNREQGQGEREQPKSPQMSRTASSRRQRPDTSFTNSEESEGEDLGRRGGNVDRTAGETTTHVESDLGENLLLKFEIFIVKVPLFSLHGIQFKKVAGGTWQYKNMAQRILDALRL